MSFADREKRFEYGVIGDDNCWVLQANGYGMSKFYVSNFVKNRCTLDYYFTDYTKEYFGNTPSQAVLKASVLGGISEIYVPNQLGKVSKRTFIDSDLKDARLFTEEISKEIEKFYLKEKEK